MAMTPVGELRLAIPMGVAVYGLNPFLVYFISLAGNLVPVFLILVLLGPVSDFLSKRFQVFCRFFSFLFSKTRKDHSSRIKRYGKFVLVALVAIPLPITGGWTASLAAFVFGVPFRKAFPLIALGVAIAGLVVSFVVRAGAALEKHLGPQILLSFILLAIFGFLFYKSRKNGKDSFTFLHKKVQ